MLIVIRYGSQTVEHNSLAEAEADILQRLPTFPAEAWAETTEGDPVAEFWVTVPNGQVRLIQMPLQPRTQPRYNDVAA